MKEKSTVTTRAEIFALIKSFAGQANILTIPRLFIEYTGGINNSILLSQLIYWSDKTSRLDRFIFKTYSEWQREIGLNEYAVRKAANHLKQMGILETKVLKANGNPTLHYRLIFPIFSTSFLNYLKKRNFIKNRNERANSKGSITETTLTDTTPKITDENALSSEAQSSYVLEIIKNILKFIKSYEEGASTTKG